MLFKDRTEAGRRLAGRLMKYRESDPIVLALPRGGVVVGYEVASSPERFGRPAWPPFCSIS